MAADDPDFEELSPEDLRYFETKLKAEREAIVARAQNRAREALGTDVRLPDEVDQASTEHARAFELRLAGKDRKLLGLIEHALHKIRHGQFGFCEGTDLPIPRARLEVRPWARYSIAYKEELEHERAQYADD